MSARIATLALGSLLSLCVASNAMAGRVMPERAMGHPRINEVAQRLASQQSRIAEGVRRGQITRWQAARDMSRDQRIERQLMRDEVSHDGHVTIMEQNRLNRELDRNSIHIYQQGHPAARQGPWP